MTTDSQKPEFPNKYEVVLTYREEEKHITMLTYAFSEENAIAYCRQGFLEGRRDNPEIIKGNAKIMEICK